jgi:uncharacterized protein YabE (DUF348 family)
MKKLLLLALVVLLLLTFATPVAAEVTHERVTVCKNGKTMKMNSQAAARQHTGGRVTYGACP